jgi:hypothetical protein
MAPAIPSTSLVPVQPAFTAAERLALAGYLAGYRGLTREACTLDLRQFTAWCHCRSLPLFAARRADIEMFARELEAKGRARATVARRLCTIAGFCKYAVEEELLDHSPAAQVTPSPPGLESHATALDRNEVGQRPDRPRVLRPRGSGRSVCLTRHAGHEEKRARGGGHLRAAGMLRSARE